MQLKLTDFTQLFEESKEVNKRCQILLEEMKAYHTHLLEELNKIYEIAKKARAKGLDPSTEVEIPIARNMAERVEQLMKIEGLARRIIELEEEGLSREEICFKIAEEIVKGKFGEFDRLTAIDKAIRTAVAILTEGVVAAPIEGIAKVKIDKNHDGTEFLKIYYAGPIRSAGGTAQVISVLVGDYIRRIVGLNRYIPTEEEILRYCEEIPLYKKVANLQYLPSDAEIKLIVSNCPVCIDGEPTEDVEVSGYRNLPRVETNRVRGGMCLVIAEGIALKAPKLKKMVDKLGIDGWEWLDKLINKEFEEERKAEEVEKYTSGLYEGKAEENEEEEEVEIAEKLDKEEKSEESQIRPKDKYLSDIVAGRPVFSHPSKKGGFRLRYGRARNSGFATVGINPATMIIADSFIAIGTQLKVERPGKAGGVVPVTSIEGPTVRLKNGDVVKINTVQEALALKDKVDKILDMGEILINFGDFLENNHPLMPSSYVYEWWIQEVEGKIPKGDYRKIDEDKALELCDEYGVPLHPDHTYLWHDISVDDYIYLRNYVAEHGKVEGRGKSCLVLDYDERAKKILEDLLVEHKVRDEKIVLDKWKVLVRCLGLTFELKPIKAEIEGNDVLSIVRKLSGLDVRAKAPTRIGARMGRPEKSKERRMSPPPHMLFPLGLAGGNQRNLKQAINYTESYNSTKGEVAVEIALRRCKECGKETFWLKCDHCGGLTDQIYYCPKCRIKIGSEVCPRCGEEAKGYMKRRINVRELYENALKNLNEWDSFDTIKGVIGLTSKIKMPERIEKGILRAKHGVFVFKDGTIRYDMTDLPITHFKPKEINVSVEKLKELGYTVDWQGNELKSEDQIVELKPQDVILSKDCAEYLVKVAKFIDDLLVKFYGLEPFYNVEKPEDLIGHLVIGLAPHTSAGVLGRIVGFTDVLAGYAHPYFHAAKRRNCFAGDTEVLVNIDGKVRRITVKELYELFENERFEKGVWIRDKPKANVRVYSFDPESGKVVLTDIVDVIKAPSPEHLIEIELEGGRVFTVTPDHDVLVYENEEILKKKAFEVKEGDVMVSPLIEFDEEDVKQIDLLKEFAKLEDLHNIVTVRGIKQFLEGILSVEERKRYYTRLKLDSISLNELLEILEAKGLTLEDVPQDAQLGVKRDKVRVKRFVKIEPLLKLVGYYLAEGYARCSRSCYQIVFSTFDGKVKSEIVEAVKEAFGDGVRVNEREWKLTISSRIIYLLFTRILRTGSNAHDKRVPSFVFKLPKEKVRILLSAYFTGDGSALKTKPRVSVYSVYLPLLRDIELLLMRFGIKGYFTMDRNANRGNSIALRYYKHRGLKAPISKVYAFNIAGEYYDRFFEEIGFNIERKQSVYDLHRNKTRRKDLRRTEFGWLLRVRNIRYVKASEPFVYCLNARHYHNVLINDYIVSAQCDGDEDCVMLLLDGLLNFSRYYLPDKRGGQMDAPLVLTAIVDPREVDSEVHNMDIVERYPLDFYKATLRYADPKELVGIIERVEDRLESELRFCCLSFTHDTESIALGVKESAYKSLETMKDKVNAQMNLAEKIVAVDEHDVAERVLKCHFLPDIIGNLRAFSRQEFRCVNCNAKYRRLPLAGKCLKCGGKLTLTVHNSSITKYLDLSKFLCEKYNISNYTKQRLMLIDLEIKSLFESDTRRQIKISDFFG